MEKFKSRKLIVGVVAAVLIMLNDALGKPVSSEGIYSAIGILGVYILGQGIADSGAQGAMAIRPKSIPVMMGTVQPPPPADDDDDDEDDGPSWEHTSEMDAEDEPKELVE